MSATGPQTLEPTHFPPVHFRDDAKAFVAALAKDDLGLVYMIG